MMHGIVHGVDMVVGVPRGDGLLIHILHGDGEHGVCSVQIFDHSHNIDLFCHF